MDTSGVSDALSGGGSGMQYIRQDFQNPECVHVLFSNRAYASILSEVIQHNRNETGGVLIGNIYNRVWYIVETIDSGIFTVNSPTFFRWDQNYVNHVISVRRNVYKYPPSILGFWHRHPGSLDTFSAMDEMTIRRTLKSCPHGLISMLVNIDPDFRMTCYYCFGKILMSVSYDYGDEYFLSDILACASPQELIGRSPQAKTLRVKPHATISPKQFAKRFQAVSGRIVPGKS